jgi:hypothetical protein
MMGIHAGMAEIKPAISGLIGDSTIARQSGRGPGFASRMDSWFRAESGKPLKRAAKKPPLREGSGNYTRA